MARALALVCGMALALSACSGDGADKTAGDDSIPDEAARQFGEQPEIAGDAGIGTPLADRVAKLGLLNKRNNISQDIELKPGESRRIGNVVIRLASCERTLPWETPRETGAFVQVLVQERRSADDPLRWRQVFSGWLFQNSPSINVVEHPIYDVWVKDCAMNFPGEDAPVEGPESAPRSTPSPAPPAVAPAATPAPAPAPAPAVSSSEE